jgi:hypothetical protein
MAKVETHFFPIQMTFAPLLIHDFSVMPIVLGGLSPQYLTRTQNIPVCITEIRRLNEVTGLDGPAQFQGYPSNSAHHTTSVC